MAILAFAVLCGVAMAPSAAAKILRPWGSNLSQTPTLDTANGASHRTGDRSTRHVLNPYPHDGADLALWNSHLRRGRATAPAGGQVLAIRIKGCALKDRSAPTQLSGGVPANQINFQALAPTGGGETASAVAAGFSLPFCSNTMHPGRGRISTHTITTFHPIHLCVSRGDAVDFYDIGGFIPNPTGPSWYPEGVPFDVISRVGGASMDSFEDANAAGGVYVPGARPSGSDSGWGVESGEELMLQVIEGTGGDAYGLCPGGTAEEALDSNHIICAYHAPFDQHRRCGAAADVAAREAKKTFR
ncbi:MAG TPA: hypothetical protein VMD09_18075 [Solirubrobacteraceae bacterium]|nr:hypothetical protein [Solirubrobacteraceae bacterium]